MVTRTLVQAAWLADRHGLVLLELTTLVKPPLAASLHLTVVPGLGSQSPGTGEEVMDTQSQIVGLACKCMELVKLLHSLKENYVKELAFLL